VADQQFLDIAVTGAVSILVLDDLRIIPEVVFRPNTEDGIGPLLHRNVFTIAVNVLLARIAAESNVEVAANAVSDITHITLGR